MYARILKPNEPMFEPYHVNEDYRISIDEGIAEYDDEYWHEKIHFVVDIPQARAIMQILRAIRDPLIRLQLPVVQLPKYIHKYHYSEATTMHESYRNWIKESTADIWWKAERSLTKLWKRHENVESCKHVICNGTYRYIGF